MLRGMTNNDLLILNHVLNTLKKQGGKPYFAFFTHRLSAAIKADVDAINEAIKPPEGLAAFQEAREKLLNELGDKDEDGNLIRKDAGNGLFTVSMLKNKAEFEAKFASLAAEHKAVLDEANAKAVAANELLNAAAPEITYKAKVKVDIFPDGVTGEQLDVLGAWLE